MALKCKKQQELKDFVLKNYPTAVFDHPSGQQTKVTFTCGLIMNIFTNDTINFQGKSHASETAEDLRKIIEILNK